MSNLAPTEEAYIMEFESSIKGLPIEEQVRERCDFYEQFVTNDSPVTDGSFE